MAPLGHATRIELEGGVEIVPRAKLRNERILMVSQSVRRGGPHIEMVCGLEPAVDAIDARKL
jgi:hypothetical protein